jgi:hypothetical protein
MDPINLSAYGPHLLLCHGSIVAELLRVVPNVVPAGEVQSSDPLEHRFAIYCVEVLLLVPIRDEGVGHLAFDHRDLGIAKANLVTRIDNSTGSDGGDVG